MSQPVSLGDLPLFTMLKSKMRWHQGRQRIIAENVANADTPDYRSRDLKQPTFAQLLQPARGGGVGVLRTNVAHMTGPKLSNDPAYGNLKNTDWEVTPEGNGVVIEEQMMKAAENQMDYQLATTLYSKSLGLLRTALGRRG